MLIGACVGFGLSVGVWLYWIQYPTTRQNPRLDLLSTALGLSHGSFLLLCVHHFTKG